MKKWLFNPFVAVAGWQALGSGLLLMMATLVTASFSHTNFDGAIDVHFNGGFTFEVYVFEQVNAWLCAVIIFFVVGSLLSKSKIRMIDVAGTLALARAPMLFAALIGFVPALHHINLNHITASFMVWSLIVLLFSIWMIALMYNALTVSCNLKGNKAIIGFIVSIILSEILSKIIIYQFYQFFTSK